MRCRQVVRQRFLRVIVAALERAHVSSEAKTSKVEAAKAAAPFSGLELSALAAEDEGWQAILEVLRKRRAQAKAARKHVAKVRRASRAEHAYSAGSVGASRHGWSVMTRQCKSLPCQAHVHVGVSVEMSK